ncbi:protein FAM178B [Ambystoma mexicanum]|uniref:protein FAM178B n=1 Tax=Ambystoma mexicanum TaxID=8296 RepID=UPI0037E81F06
MTGKALRERRGKLQCLAPITITPVSEDLNSSLDHVLQEKLQGEHTVLEDELEKSLKQCLYVGQGFAHSPSASTSGEELLVEEHRLFIKRYSVSSNGIPSIYPGEDIFTEPQHLQLGNPSAFFMLDTRDLPSRHILEHMLFSSSFLQQMSFIRDGFLSFLYRCLPCPKPVLSWLFQLLAAPPEVSMDSFKAIWDLSMDILLKAEDGTGYMWCPTLQEVVMVFQNLGARPAALLPGDSLPRHWTPGACCTPVPRSSDAKIAVSEDTSMQGPGTETPLATNLSHVFKYLTLCSATRPRWYTDCELLTLVRILSKASLDRALRCQPKEDLRQLLSTLLNNIRSWERKLPDLCVSLSQLSEHHHNLLSIVQHIPVITARGRQLQRHLSLVVIAKVLGKTRQAHLCKDDEQLPMLCRLLGFMKPSALKYHLEQVKKAEEPQSAAEQQTDLDREVCYLCHTLLMLSNMVVGSEAIPLGNWNYLHALCIQLDQQIMRNIRETPQFMYRSKVKDLAVRTYVKWQELLVQGQPRELYPCACATPWPASEPSVDGTMSRMSEEEEESEAPRLKRVVDTQARVLHHRQATDALTSLQEKDIVETNSEPSIEAQTCAVCESKDPKM